jgi:hypothetical protein
MSPGINPSPATARNQEIVLRSGQLARLNPIFSAVLRWSSLPALGLMLAWIPCGCGSGSVTASALIGTWQADLPRSQRIVYTFYPNGTYDMVFNNKPGTLKGIWALSGNRLTLSAASFVSFGLTNSLVTAPLLQSPVETISKITSTTMNWRTTRFRPSMRFKRINAPQSAAAG